MEDFLRSHPELATSEALLLAESDNTLMPASLREDVPPQAKLALLRALTEGEDLASAVQTYVNALSDFIINEVAADYDALTEILATDSSVNRIPESRRILSMAQAMGREEERLASLDLATRLLQLPEAELALASEEVIGLFETVRALSESRDAAWVAATGNLALAISQQPGTDPVATWIESCRLFREACAASDRSTDPDSWGINQSNLGYALTRRPGGSTAEDLGEALITLNESLTVRTLDTDIVGFAYTKLNLGIVFFRRGQDGDLDAAIAAYQEALARLDGQTYQLLWAALQYNLSLALLERRRDLISLSSSIDESLSLVKSPYYRGLFLALKATMAEERQAGSDADLLSLRAGACALIDPVLHPEDHLNIGKVLVEAQEKAGLWDDAATQYERILLAFRSLYDAQATARGRQEVLEVHRRVPRWAAYAFARAGRYARAAEVIEAGRATELSVMVARESLELERLLGVDPALVERYRAAYQQHRIAVGARFDSVGALTVDSDDDRARAANQALKQVLNEIRAIPTFESFAREMTIEDIAVALEDLAGCYLIVSPYGSYCVTVVAGENSVKVSAVDVREVTGNLIANIAIMDFDSGRLGLLAAQASGYSLDIPLADLALATAIYSR